MTEQKTTNGLSLVCNDSGRHIIISADISFSVEEQNGITSVHFADAVYTLILESLKKKAEGAQLFPGEYRMMLTAVSSLVPPEVVTTEELVSQEESVGDEADEVQEAVNQ